MQNHNEVEQKYRYHLRNEVVTLAALTASSVAAAISVSIAIIHYIFNK